MKKGLWKLSAAAAIFAAPLSTAQANLILAPNPFTSGNGLGAVNTVLTIQNNPTESGCVGGSIVGGTFTDFYGSAASGNCVAATPNDVKTGASQTQTQMLGTTGVTSASNFGIVLNAAEPNGNSVTLNSLTATFYNPSTGAVLYTASYVGSPLTFASTGTGTGTAGYLFILDNTQAGQLATAAAGVGITNVRVGLSAGLSGTQGGNETFYVGNNGTTAAAVPEPSTYALMGSGLLGLVGFARRRRRA